MRKLVVADDVLRSNPDVSKFELVLIASKMHRMGLRPTLAECLRALENNEVESGPNQLSQILTQIPTLIV